MQEYSRAFGHWSPLKFEFWDIADMVQEISENHLNKRFNIPTEVSNEQGAWRKKTYGTYDQNPP